MVWRAICYGTNTPYMRLAVFYLRIIKNNNPDWVAPLPYEPSSNRFLSSYIKFKPKIPHDLIVVNCGSAVHDGKFDKVAAQYRTSYSLGFDCGTYQDVGSSNLDYDLILGVNTHTYFWREGWLERFESAFNKFGPGVYGASGSYEQNRHIRTTGIAFTPDIISRYPKKIDTREKAGEFEFGPNNFTIWAQSEGYPAIVVAAGADYHLHEIRKIKSGFRRHDQRNMLIWDRHSDIYARSDLKYKAHLESVVYDPAPQ